MVLPKYIERRIQGLSADVLRELADKLERELASKGFLTQVSGAMVVRGLRLRAAAMKDPSHD